ncbi:MAG: hypothetical protein JO222_10515 [Frankiales bacterium]|nr:hypothetical protein [Frankiales bacterium]
MPALRPRDFALPVTVGAATLAFAAALGVASLGAKASTANHHLAASADPGSSAFREQVLGVARQFAVDFTAYDYRHISDDFNRVALESTGQFHQQYLTQSAAARDLIVKAKAVSTAQVTAAGLGDVTATKATVVVALNRTIANTSSPSPQPDSIGIQVVLVRQHGRWLASQVTLL